MAKSARAHVVKRNRAKLRSTVFGPASDARTERLSAKLQDIASQPKPEDQKESKMELSTSGTGMFDESHTLPSDYGSMLIISVQMDRPEVRRPRPTQMKVLSSIRISTSLGSIRSILAFLPKLTKRADMDIDAGSSKASASTSRRSGRIQKRGKRNRSSIVFQTRQSKGKSGQKKK